jgi:hypothetical protein
MNLNREINAANINAYLEETISECDRWKIEFYNEKLFAHAMNDISSRLALISKVSKNYENHNLRILGDAVNSIILSDPELHCVSLILIRSKFLPQIDKSKTALIIYHI